MADGLIAPALPQADLARSASNAKAAKDKNAIQAAAKNFEAMYMNEMMSYMFEGIETDGPFGGGRGEEIFRSLMIEQYGKKMADSGQTGITQMMTKEMLRMQEERLNPRQGAAHVTA